MVSSNNFKRLALPQNSVRSTNRIISEIEGGGVLVHPIQSSEAIQSRGLLSVIALRKGKIREYYEYELNRYQ